MSSAIPTDEETLARLQPIRSQGIGSVTYHNIISRYENAQNAVSALPDLAKQAGRRTPFKPATRESVQRELNQLEKIRGQLIRFGDEDYPVNLGQISDAPPFLTVLGDISQLRKPSVGIVGARNASLNGKKNRQYADRRSI